MTSLQSGNNLTISRLFSRTSKEEKEEEKQRTREGQSTKDDKNDDSNNSDKHTVDNEEDSRKEEIVEAKDASEHKTPKVILIMIMTQPRSTSPTTTSTPSWMKTYLTQL